MSGNLFVKKIKSCKNIHILEKQKILDMLPPNVATSENVELQKTNVEWRVRFLLINNKELVEIRNRFPNNKCTYVNKNGKWIEYNIDPVFDNFVTKQYYIYTPLK